eukprot:TRINITY_DN12456_c0_g1_i1.p1 TRINITY_DN12456_c0_g1~~TRINITY_DN12456_c0_g1_i1.p1  ORF type:complete len:462 (+),score=15.55 TRINITY_DN12456_c0_g1_i1:106-1491(+)
MFDKILNFFRVPWLLFMLVYGIGLFFGSILGTFFFGGCLGKNVLWTIGNITPEYCSIFGAWPPIIIGPISLCVATIHIYITSRLISNYDFFPLFTRSFDPLKGSKGNVILGMTQAFTVFTASWSFLFWVICNSQYDSQVNITSTTTTTCWTQAYNGSQQKANNLRLWLMIGSIFLAAGCAAGSMINFGFGFISALQNDETEPLLPVVQGTQPLLSIDHVATNVLKFKLEPTDIKIHDCVKLAVGDLLWNSDVYQNIYRDIKEHIKNNEEVQKALKKSPKLTKAEICSLLYFTSDTFDEKVASVYQLLNRALTSRNSQNLEVWLPFLYYMYEAKKHLPHYQGVVYRGIRSSITTMSSHYFHGNCVVWPAFSSTSKNQTVMEDFAKGVGNNGTWMIINIKEGIELPFSLIPTEDEVLLFPNTVVQLDQILTVNTKKIFKVPPELDVMELTQRKLEEHVSYSLT